VAPLAPAAARRRLEAAVTAVLCSFVLGVWVLQQQAELPQTRMWLACAALALGVAVVLCAVRKPWRYAGWAGRALQGQPAPSGARCTRTGASTCAPTGAAAAVCVRVAVCLLAAIVGFVYAGLRAEARLAGALPLAWEGRDVMLTGVVRGLPASDPQGCRFSFDVESTEPAIADFPRTVQLAWRESAGEYRSRQRSRAVGNGDHPDHAPDNAEVAPGDRWTFAARLKRPHANANFNMPDAEAALLERGVRATGYVRPLPVPVRAADRAHGVRIEVDRLRAAIRERIGVALRGDGADAPPHTGIVVALAVGAQDGISDADWLQLRRSGINHLVAISGLHIGSVAGWVALLAGALWRRSLFIGRNFALCVPVPLVTAVSGVLAAMLYAALAGLGIPAQRALIMLGVAAAAFVTGRLVDVLLVLAWALAIVVVIDPWATLSASATLSFGAVAVIVFAMKSRGTVVRHRAGAPGDWPSLDPSESPRGLVASDAPNAPDARSAPAWRAARWARDACATLADKLATAIHAQWAVTIGLAPLTVLWFSQIPITGPLANALAIPWVSFLVTPAVLAGVALPAPLDAYAYRFAHDLLDSMLALLAPLAHPPWALWRLPAPTPLALALAIGGVAWMLAPRGWPLRFAAPLLWLPLLWPAPRGPRDGEFRVTAIDVGQGGAALVETARHRLLFDAGPGPEAGDTGRRIVVPFLVAQGAWPLDEVVISHADADHAGGAPALLAEIDVARLRASLPAAHPLWRTARHAGAQTAPCRAGDTWRWDGVTFEMLWPDRAADPAKPNQTSCVLRVSNERHAVLFAADIEAAAERRLVAEHAQSAQALRAELLLAPHHGSRTSSTEAFLDAVRPLISIFQMGYRNRFNHPHPLIVARYRVRAIDMLRSDDDGAVRIETDAGALIVEALRRSHRRYWMGR
jgi:competence protein ComEC